jgi:hypothetical protein
LGRYASLEWLRQRIESRIVYADQTDACWEWVGAFFSDGYPQISYRNRPLRVHRAVMELYRGVPGLLDKTNEAQVLHRCDNPKCVNPAHLFLGTPADNMRDRDQKGRSTHGERHRWAKLTVAEVVEIRRLRRSGMSLAAIARRFGVSKSGVNNVVNGHAWRWFEEQVIEPGT